jgi:CRISPR-associated protein Cmr2
LAADWDLLTRVFLHDPPDKALDIRGHEGRAARYCAAALGREIDAATIKADASLADTLAAVAERLPMPTAGADGQRAVAVEEGRLRVCHPLGGTNARSIPTPTMNEAAVAGAIKDIVAGVDASSSRFLALWRLLPDCLIVLDPAYAVLPADTRVPDHSIWHHADSAAALLPANSGTGAAFLSFAIAPVQSFIEAARSLRDLWSGSLILSWLAFEALFPVVEDLGPQALIFPYLRGNPLLERWLHRQPGLAGKIPDPPPEDCARPSLPNRFLALVPAVDAAGLATRCEEAAQTAWRTLAEAVRQRLDHQAGDFPGWDSRWQQQIEEFWEIRSNVLPYRAISDHDLAAFYGGRTFDESWPEPASIRALADLIPPAQRPSYDQKHAGRWQATVDLAARALEARRAIRHVPKGLATTAGSVPQKCALLGTVEQMGPGEFRRSAEFWEKLSASTGLGARLQPNERFSAIALTKRFAVPLFLEKRLGIKGHRRFPDTATVAARPWLDSTPLDWRDTDNGQWLHWHRRDQDPDEPPARGELWEELVEFRRAEDYRPPPTYLAVLVMDGDHIGKWLRGEKNPVIGDVLHPKMRDHFERFGAAATLDEAKRPVGPALHAAISEALTNFAIRIAPGIVQEHRGALIYAGGDDLLALLPAQTAVACAAKLASAFTAPDGHWEREDSKPPLLVMGGRATVSAGIAIVHHKEDLRVALGLARQAERAAKQTGRNRLHLFIARRSGERAGETLGWDECTLMTDAVKAFAGGASDRWAYRMRALEPSLRSAPSALQLEMIRQLRRSDEQTRQAIGDLFDRGAFRSDGRSFESVVRLWQAASFLARGRDEGGED